MIFFARNTPTIVILSYFRLLFLCLAGFIFPEKLLSQYRVFGKITYNNEPVNGVTILIKEDSSGVIKGYAISGVDGNYSVNYRGKRTIVFLEVSMVGFKKKFTSLQLGQNREIELSFLLTRSDQLLPEVIIKNEAAIMKKGDTTIFKIDSFTTGAEKSVAQAIEKLPGFLVSPSGMISYNGRIISRVLLEGDDIIGRNYQQIIKILSPNGINNIEVIENYSDKENITNHQSTETVINLRYKSKFLGKLNGELEAGISPDAQYYNLKTQAISLKPATKMLWVSESGNNNINTAQANISAGMTESINETTMLPLNSYSAIPEIRNNFTVAPLMYKGNSHLPTIIIRSRASKKVLLYGKIKYESLFYEQNGKTFQDFGLLPSPISFEESRTIHKKNQMFFTGFSINYTPGVRHQLVLAGGLETQHQQGDNSSVIQGFPLSESRNSKRKQFSLKAIYNKIVQNGFVNFESKLNTIRLNSALNQYNTQLNHFFGMDPSFVRLFQPESSQKIDWRTKLSLRKNSLTYILSFWIEKTRMSNDLLFSNNLYTTAVGKDSLINSSIVNRGMQFAIADRFVKNKFSFEPGIKIQVTDLTDRSGGLSSTLLQTRLYALPQVHVEYKKNSNNKFSLNFSSGIPDFPFLFIAKGYAINNLTGLQSGSGALSIRPYYSINVFHSYISIISKGLFTSTALSLSNNPLLVISNITTPGFYTYNQYAASERKTTSESLFFNATKLTSGFLKTVSPSIIFTRIKSFLNADNNTTLLTSTIVQPGFKIVCRLKKVDFSAKTNIAIINQKSRQTNLSASTQKKWESSISMDGQLFPRLFFQSLAVVSIFYPPLQPSQKLFQLEAGLSYMAKNKNWQISFSGTNVTGRNIAETSAIFPTHRESTVYRLFPRVLLLKIKRNM